MHSTTLTRRAAILGAAASSIALAAPALAAIKPEPEHPWVRARQLAKELRS